MERKRSILILCAVLLALGIQSVAAAPIAYSVTRVRLGGGGAYSGLGAYGLYAAVGQPVIGPVADGSLTLCHGVWCGAGGAGSDYLIYLPLVLHNS